MAAFSAHANAVNYLLDNVILDDDTQMSGTFSWTYDAGDFENGIGQFNSLDIPIHHMITPTLKSPLILEKPLKSRLLVTFTTTA